MYGGVSDEQTNIKKDINFVNDAIIGGNKFFCGRKRYGEGCFEC